MTLSAQLRRVVVLVLRKIHCRRESPLRSRALSPVVCVLRRRLVGRSTVIKPVRWAHWLCLSLLRVLALWVSLSTLLVLAGWSVPLLLTRIWTFLLLALFSIRLLVTLPRLPRSRRSSPSVKCVLVSCVLCFPGGLRPFVRWGWQRVVQR